MEKDYKIIIPRKTKAKRSIEAGSQFRMTFDSNGSECHLGSSDNNMCGAQSLDPPS